MLAYITANWSVVVTVVTALVVVAREIVSFTSSKTDDSVEATVEVVLNKFGLINQAALPPVTVNVAAPATAPAAPVA
jgi:hypothetical protein